jgi:hypothetical protein
VEAGSAALRVDWPVYPRRAEHNTVAEGGNRRWAETARQNARSNRAGRVLKPDQALASLVGLVLAAERERSGNRLECLDADRNAECENYLKNSGYVSA